MHADPFDRYRRRDSLIHHLDPRVKVGVTVLYILSNLLLPDGAWLGFLLSYLLVSLAGVLARLGAGYLLRRSFVALPFALAALTAIFTLPGEPVFTVRLGAWQWIATDSGLVRFASILARSWLSVQMAILLTATTQFPDLVHALRHLRLPQVLVAIVSFMYRYLHVLADETLRLLRARQARSARITPAQAGARQEKSTPSEPGPIASPLQTASPRPSITWQARIAGNMAGQLFLRSYERSDRVYAAMQARGFAGQLLTMNPHVMRSRDWLAAVLAVLALLLVQIVGRLAS
jgi:cobalt/nickel transport system permease protein